MGKQSNKETEGSLLIIKDILEISGFRPQLVSPKWAEYLAAFCAYFEVPFEDTVRFFEHIKKSESTLDEYAALVNGYVAGGDSGEKNE